MQVEYKTFHNCKTLSERAKRFTRKRARSFIEANEHNRQFNVFEENDRPIALVALYRHPNPRIKKQCLIDLYYDGRYRKKALVWLKERLGEFAMTASEGTTVNIKPKDETFFKGTMQRTGFNVRYELLAGKPEVALRELIRKRNPPEILEHIGLQIRPFHSQKNLTAAMRLQRRVSLQSRQHTFFSHTSETLRKDKQEYAAIIRHKTGLILGIYRDGELLGMMMTTIFASRSGSKMAGFSFFLDRSIQGQGIASTGYRLLLTFLVKQKVSVFTGGTSQPAIRKLGQIMKREIKAVSYVKMS